MEFFMCQMKPWNSYLKAELETFCDYKRDMASIQYYETFKNEHGERIPRKEK